MRKVKVFVNNKEAGIFTELIPDKEYTFEYLEEYLGHPVSLTMPLHVRNFRFDRFPAFFEGLLPEGFQLEGLLNHSEIDRNDLFSQLIQVGNDMIGAVTVKEIAL